MTSASSFEYHTRAYHLIYTSTMTFVWKKLLFALALSGLGFSAAAKPYALTYLVLADTVEPLMLASESMPMQGGIVTDTLMRIFAETNYEIVPLVVPWQRTGVEMRARDNWIMYGVPSQCGRAEGCALSTEPIVEFDHVTVTLSSSPLEIHTPEDLYGRRLILVENFHYPGLDEHLKTPVGRPGDGHIQDIRAFTPAGALRMLRHRRGEAYIDWRIRVLYNLKGARLDRSDVRLTNAANLIPSQNIHFFYSDKLPIEVRQLIDARLASMRTNGILQRIIGRYQ